MTNHISSPCIILIIILGMSFSITLSSHAQGTSALREQDKIAQSMRYSLIAQKNVKRVKRD